MNQSGQRWDKYRLLPPGDVWWWWWWCGPQWASRRWNTITDSNQEESRKQEEGQAPGGVWMWRYIRTETTYLLCNLQTLQTHQKAVLLHNPSWGSASPCRSSHLFSVFEQQTLKFCLFDSACLSSYLNLEKTCWWWMSTCQLSLLHRPCWNIFYNVKELNGGQIWYSECSKSLTNRGCCSNVYET